MILTMTKLNVCVVSIDSSYHAVAACYASIGLSLGTPGTPSHGDNHSFIESWQGQPANYFLRATPRDSPHQCACLSRTSRSGFEAFIFFICNADLDKVSRSRDYEIM
jgi:hypothetical protein